MLWALFVVLIFLWALGIAGLYHAAVLAWILFIAACIVLVVQLTGGTRRHPI